MGASLWSYIEGETVGARAINFLSAFREVKVLALTVTITNIGGVAYGLFYYWNQLKATPFYLLPFVPDSPTGPFLMVVVFSLWWFRGRLRNRTLELLAFVSLTKYGIWTVLVFWLYRDDFFSPSRAGLTQTLLALHLAEALEAGVLLKGMRMPPRPWARFSAAWIFAGDFSDYVLGTHPYLPKGLDAAVGERVVPMMTVALTIICYLAAMLWCRRLANRGGASKGGSESGASGDGHSGPPP